MKSKFVSALAIAVMLFACSSAHAIRSDYLSLSSEKLLFSVNWSSLTPSSDINDSGSTSINSSLLPNQRGIYVHVDWSLGGIVDDFGILFDPSGFNATISGFEGINFTMGYETATFQYGGTSSSEAIPESGATGLLLMISVLGLVVYRFRPWRQASVTDNPPDRS